VTGEIKRPLSDTIWSRTGREHRVAGVSDAVLSA
jgi:hypothetical protein